MIMPGIESRNQEDGNMRRSLTRIRTSHIGRLPPPKGWADMPARVAGGEITDPVVIAAKVTPAIAETVKKQIETGIDCIGDGEFWTARNLAHYAAHFTGVEARTGGRNVERRYLGRRAEHREHYQCNSARRSRCFGRPHCRRFGRSRLPDRLGRRARVHPTAPPARRNET